MAAKDSVSAVLLSGSSIEINFGDKIEQISEIKTSSNLPLLTTPMFDSHTHGGSGAAVVGDKEELLRVLQHGKRHGTSHMILSLVSSSIEEIEKVLSLASEIGSDQGLVGIHLEGPYIASERCGAHDPKQLRDLTDSELNIILQHKSLKSITVASERVSLDQVRRLSQAGVTVALGHTNASYEEAMDYFAAGAKVLTHAFNAMPQIESRAPGPVIAALESGAYIEVIADGHHVKPALVRQLADWAGDKLILVTDSMAAAGMADGTYSLGEVAVEVKDSVARRVDNGALAGSTLTLNKAVQNLISWGVAPKDTIAAVTTNPAACYGIELREIAVGSVAEFLLWDQNFDLVSSRLG